MSTPDPHQNWSGAPKHWVHVPAQRHGPPTSEELDDVPRQTRGCDATRARQIGEWSVAAVALAVAVAAFVLIGMRGEADPPPPDRTNGTLVR